MAERTQPGQHPPVPLPMTVRVNRQIFRTGAGDTSLRSSPQLLGMGLGVNTALGFVYCTVCGTVIGDAKGQHQALDLPRQAAMHLRSSPHGHTTNGNAPLPAQSKEAKARAGGSDPLVPLLASLLLEVIGQQAPQGQGVMWSQHFRFYQTDQEQRRQTFGPHSPPRAPIEGLPGTDPRPHLTTLKTLPPIVLNHLCTLWCVQS